MPDFYPYSVVSAPEYYLPPRAQVIKGQAYYGSEDEGEVLSRHKTMEAAIKAAEGRSYFSYNAGGMILPVVVADNTAGLSRGNRFAASNAPPTLWPRGAGRVSNPEMKKSTTRENPNMAKRTYARREFLSDILTTAAEGGVNYWGHVNAYNWADTRVGEDPAESVMDIWVDEESVEEGGLPTPVEYKEGQFSAYDPEERFGIYHVDIEVVSKGINLIVGGKTTIHPSRLVDYKRANKLIEGYYNSDGWLDSEAADIIVQVGLFGEIVFG